MRDIKFRAYHIEEEKMINIENLLSFSNDGDIWINENKQIPLNVFSGWASKDFKLMQYTGFKDKNGVEIYEGDLLQSFYDDGEIHEVIWHEESASFRVATYLDNRHGGSFAELFFMDDIHENCNEIIGNIYENTELLEYKNEKD